VRRGSEADDCWRNARGCRARVITRPTPRSRDYRRRRNDRCPVGPDPSATLDEAMRERGAAWLLVGLAFPGNIGLSIRTAEVSGAALVAIDPPLVGEPKRGALRASIGADRFFPGFWTDATAVVASARAAGRRVVVLACGDRPLGTPTCAATSCSSRAASTQACRPR
jgi:tRNA G18 (ribose-2'-O)-methylase SpoU